MDLFALRNHFYVGNYQQVVADAASFNARGNSDLESECELILMRAQIALGNHFLVIQKVRDDAPHALRAAKLLAQHMQDPVGSANTVNDALDKMLCDSEAATNPNVLLLIGQIFNSQSKYEETLKHTHDSENVELMALLIQTFLFMNRRDLAEKQFATMQQKEDDHTLTQMASAWINLAKGGAVIRDALFTYTDLADKFGTSTLIFNGMAAANMGQGDFEDAESNVNSALQMNSNDVDSLINLVAILQHTRPSDARISSTLSLLQHQHPHHPYVKAYLASEDSFNRIAGISA
jgi:coatomer protein complex subunit epsilon